jgi:arylsulfatase
VAKFKGKFDAGWDALRAETFERQKKMGIIPKNTRFTPRPKNIPAWDSLTAQQKRVYARGMEAFAAALAYGDEQTGRVIDEARKASGGNLLVIYIQGDNGGSAEGGADGTLNEHALIDGAADSLDAIEAGLDTMGGPRALNHFSVGWAHATNTPFQWTKILVSHFGATRNGMVISWPDHIKKTGEIRSQFHYVSDIAPTILEAAKISLPNVVNGIEQKSLDGISMSYTFNDAGAPDKRKTQLFNVWDNLAIYHDGWMASTTPELFPWEVAKRKPIRVEGRNWELYNVAMDFSQSQDLAKRYPDRLAELQQVFWDEAARNKALPIHMPTGRIPSPFDGEREIVLKRGIALPPGGAPRLLGRSFAISAKVTVPVSGGQGVLLAQGGRFGGLSLFFDQGRPVFHYNRGAEKRYEIAGADATAPGEHLLVATFDFGGQMGGPATVTLSMDGKPVATGIVAETKIVHMSLDETMDVGLDRWTPVTESYGANNEFNGSIEELKIHLTPANKP